MAGATLRRNKPDSTTAMRSLIAEMRNSLPFDSPEAQTCTDPCRGCSIKLLDYIASELDAWEERLDAGEKPGLADLSRLEKKGRKVYRALQANQPV
jgi:hypothetical protein